MTALEIVAAIRAALMLYVFRARTEAELQDQVTLALSGEHPEWKIASEVTSSAGRYDLQIEVSGCRIVLELKLGGAPGPVERQSQRYALADVDAVVVVTTSRRLAGGLGGMAGLGGKPFAVVAVRTT